MDKRATTSWLISLLLALLLVGCDVNINIGTDEATPGPTPLDSATPIPATSTPEPSVPTTKAPTPTFVPSTPVPSTVPAEPEPERIEFEPGAISATLTGHVAAGSADLYVLWAMADQTMEVDLVSVAADVRLEIWGEDGTPLKRAAVGGPSWTGTLPLTQDYFIKVISFGSAADYTLTVTVLPLESERPATRIEFAPGATSATVTGHVGAHQADLYVLRALEGQIMEVEVDSPAEDVLLEIWGEDGVPLKRHVDGESSWTGELYASQDYFIHVISFGSAADYTLTVTIPPLGEGPEPRPQPQRIQFAPGATSATVTGDVDAYEHDVYVLRALSGQTMTVELISPASDVVLEIWGADGQPLLRHVTGQTTWTGLLHATQDYFIKVVSFGSAVDYTLTVTIPPT
ncbi:MAG: hypothetical protein PVH17_00065 [Anaerolineae bacterium]|jgi:hypothetical protein